MQRALFFTAIAAAALFGGQALADPAQDNPFPATSATEHGTDVAATSNVPDNERNRPPSAIDPVTGRPVIFLSSPTPANQAYTLKPGDPAVINSPPVPDTPENRAKYGEPMSRAGKLTAPAGN